MIGARLGSLIVLCRLWKRTPAADRVELWSAWRDMLPELRDHIERIKRQIVGRIALIELANVENVMKARQS